MKKIAIKTDNELKQIAVDLFDGKIFTDRHCRSEREVTSSFMIISLGGLSKMSKKRREDIGMIYEYLSDAAPVSMNGNPVFFSMRILTKNETKKMFEFYENYKTLKESFLVSKENNSKKCKRDMTPSLCSVSNDCNKCEHYIP